jgi:hypothetical protein
MPANGTDDNDANKKFAPEPDGIPENANVTGSNTLNWTVKAAAPMA